MADNKINREKIALFLAEFELGNFVLLDNYEILNSRTNRKIGAKNPYGDDRISAYLPFNGDNRKQYTISKRQLMYALYHGNTQPDNTHVLFKDREGDYSKENLEIVSHLEAVQRKTKPDRQSSRALTDQQVIYLRTEYSKGLEGYARLALRFGVSKPVIRSAIMGLTYKHIPGAITSDQVSRVPRVRIKSKAEPVRPPNLKVKKVEPAKPPSAPTSVSSIQSKPTQEKKSQTVLRQFTKPKIIDRDDTVVKIVPMSVVLKRLLSRS